ncbi:CFF_collapsed_G0021830.mRNA.1.CDS.1 [Saccharomyces cerevisiae]|nr:CFF_collapsed_G0021830.mRNA.1.CDS.1 [Saccharomyces cerevisiae]
MYKLDNNDIDDETNNSVSLTSLLEFLDPIASKVVSKYYHGSHPFRKQNRNCEILRVLEDVNLIMNMIVIIHIT